MRARQHMLGGIVAWELVGPAVSADLPTLVGGFAFAVWGSLGSDMDHASSTWSQSFPLGKRAARVSARALGGHRAGTHSLASVLVSGLACAGPLALAALGTVPISGAQILAWSVAFAVAWFSHIVLDSTTVMGCAWFYPFSARKHSVGTMLVSSSSRLNRGELWVARVLLFTGFLLAIPILGDSLDVAGLTAVDHSAGAGGDRPVPHAGAHGRAVRVHPRP